jgi:predicted DCC family thiol-disulfide oxidoreductase YuxK
MNILYVLYDVRCLGCGDYAYWLSRQPALVELKFIPLRSPEVACRFPGLDSFQPDQQLLVVSDEGAVYQGPQAWIMGLYALKRYREWSLLLAHPTLLPVARPACELISTNRLCLAQWLGKEEQLADRLRELVSEPHGNATVPHLLAKKCPLNS